MADSFDVLGYNSFMYPTKTLIYVFDICLCSNDGSKWPTPARWCTATLFKKNMAIYNHNTKLNIKNAKKEKVKQHSSVDILGGERGQQIISSW